ncbi:MAG: F0F1 ATP synthase subunit B [candidate division Zixibacteria bacterium]|nr:F0F1 ATP synthase subunit B [candidate division Zixibacteria bacterium]
MDLQWQQLLTHIVGFLITVWILKRFAWGPLLDILEERRQKITGEFQNIEDKKAEVDKLKDDYESKLKNIENERRAKLVEAVDEGKKIAAKIEADARTKTHEIEEKSKADLERNIAKAKVQLKDEMITITMAAAEKILDEKLDHEKDKELIGRFIENVEKA